MDGPIGHHQENSKVFFKDFKLIGLLKDRIGPKGSKVSKDCGTFHAQSLSLKKSSFILGSPYILLKVIKDLVKSSVKY